VVLPFSNSLWYAPPACLTHFSICSLVHFFAVQVRGLMTQMRQLLKIFAMVALLLAQLVEYVDLTSAGQ
jgi:hypothetical protein